MVQVGLFLDNKRLRRSINYAEFDFVMKNSTRSANPNDLGFGALLGQVETLAHTRQRKRVRLLAELTPRLQCAQEVERQRDQRLARRFNVFKYLRTDELGLSQLIADLLNPEAEHGQGSLFLQAMLDQLPRDCVLPSEIQVNPRNQIKVLTERGTPAGRRIDVSVDIPDRGGPYCLAFENKPYAEDEPRQILDYLNFLKSKYRSHFLLVYVPPEDRMPSEIALPAKCVEKWSANFCVMPYNGASNSLERWVAECRRRCEVERLDWFLRQFQTFCNQRFGGLTMTSDAETREIRAYLWENSNQMQSALAVHDAWQVIREEICKDFLEHLRGKLEECLKQKETDFKSGLKVRCVYGGEKRGANALWITRDDWPRHEIKLECGAYGSRSWYWGVRCNPRADTVTESQQQFRENLKTAIDKSETPVLKGDDAEWPHFEWLSDYADWHQLAPVLFEEKTNCGGEVTDHYLKGLLDIATCVVPVLDEFAISGSEGKTG